MIRRVKNFSILNSIEKYDKLLTESKEDIEKWGKLKHNKECLELFLANNIAEILFETKDKGEIKMLLTSNVELVKRLNRVVPPITPIPTDNDDIFKCKAKNMVLTWNIPFNKFASIHGSKWQIMNFITIKKENVELLHEALNNLIIIRKENLPS